MGVDLERLYYQFKEMCYDLKGTLIEKYPEYTCVVTRKEDKKFKKYYFIINLVSSARVPFHINAYEYYDNKLDIIGYSIAYTYGIEDKGDYYLVISGSLVTNLKIYKEPLSVKINVRGYTIGKEAKYYEYDLDKEDFKKLYTEYYEAVNFIACHEIEGVETTCRKIPISEAIYYVNKKVGGLSLRGPFVFLYEHDVEFKNLYNAVKDVEYLEASYIDSLFGENRGLIPFIRVFKKVLETEETGLKDIIKQGWEVTVVPTTSDLMRFYREAGRGVTIYENKEIVISLGESYGYSEKDLVETLVHESLHAYREITGKRKERGVWIYEKGKFIPKGEEEKIEELTRKIIKEIAKELSKGV